MLLIDNFLAFSKPESLKSFRSSLFSTILFSAMNTSSRVSTLKNALLPNSKKLW